MNFKSLSEGRVKTSSLLEREVELRFNSGAGRIGCRVVTNSSSYDY